MCCFYEISLNSWLLFLFHSVIITVVVLLCFKEIQEQEAFQRKTLNASSNNFLEIIINTKPRGFLVVRIFFLLKTNKTKMSFSYPKGYFDLNHCIVKNLVIYLFSAISDTQNVKHG